MPLVSVIVPVRNAERHIRECLSSIRNQTLTDFELILVDDGSTDATPGILAEFVAGEPRARVVPGPRRGSAGAARNVGMAQATGDFLSFLDADDIFLPTLLEELHAKAVADEAEVVACKFSVHDDVTGEVTRPDWMLRAEQLPASQPFSGSDVGDWIFMAFNPAAWNKLFRADYIRARGLRFQELRRANDAYFTYMALAMAERISYLDRHLVTYRVANASSLQGTKHEDPMEFVRMLEETRATLRREGLWPRTERAFSQLAIRMCAGNLKRQTEAEAFLEVYRALRGGVLEEFGLLGRPDGYFLRPVHASWLKRVTTSTAEEFLFRRATKAEADAAAQGLAAREAARSAARRQRLRSTPEAAAAPAPADDPDAVDVSVVIPVYNSLGYLAACVESAQSQTGCSLEIVCVDDGSTDGSGEVLDRYAAADPRIRVVHQENTGLSGARNAGVAIATGRYLCFLDSDDRWTGTGQLAQLVRAADERSLDVLHFDAVCVRDPGVDDKLWAKYDGYYERQAYDGDYDGVALLAAMQAADEYRASACLYLVRRRLVEAHALRFYPGIAHEDNLYTFALLLHAQRAGHSRLRMHERRVRPGSIVTAGSRAAAAQGYFITWVEMVRLLRGRDLGDDEITRQVAGEVQWIYSAVRRSTAGLDSEAVATLLGMDDDADAAALYRVVRRGWSDDRAKRKLVRQVAQLEASPGLVTRLKRRAKGVAKRVLRRR